MKKTIQIIVLAALCLFLSSAAQAQTKPLKVGYQLPDITINNIINYKSSSAKLSDFRGKLLILDFWATWCGSCIKKFPLLDSMQVAHNDKLQVLLVSSRSSGDTPAKISALLEKHQNAAGKDFKLPVALGDTVLKALFPHSSLPYYVWIGPGGKVIAITSSAGLTAANIFAALKNESIPLVEPTTGSK